MCGYAMAYCIVNVKWIHAQKTQESHEGKGIETWDGVWKDIDVLRAETVEETSGTYTVYVLELTASDGTNWQVGLVKSCTF